MENAIKKSIEGGYSWEQRKNALDTIKATSDILLDPLFWQALGKQQGWGRDYFHEDDGKTYWDFDYHCPLCGAIETNTEDGCPEDCRYDVAEIISWQYEWHNFIDHIAQGGNIDEFFNNLIK